MVAPKPKTETPQPKANDHLAEKSRISWARLLKRVFGIDVATCHLCAGQMKIIAAIEDPPLIKKSLSTGASIKATHAMAGPRTAVQGPRRLPEIPRLRYVIATVTQGADLRSKSS